MHVRGLGVFVRLEGIVDLQHVLVKVFGFTFPGAVRAQHLRLVLAHLLGQFRDHAVNRRIHVLALMVRLNGDMVGAMEHDFRRMPSFADVKDDVRLDDARVIQMDVLDLAVGIVADGVRNTDMASGDADGNVHVCCLHVYLLFLFSF